MFKVTNALYDNLFFCNFGISFSEKSDDLPEDYDQNSSKLNQLVFVKSGKESVDLVKTGAPGIVL